MPGGRKPVETALHTLEPFVDIVAQDIGCIWSNDFQLPWPHRTPGQRSRERKRILTIGRHDRLSRPTALNGIAPASVMFKNQARAPLEVGSWSIWRRFAENFDLGAEHGEKAEAKALTKFVDAGIGLPTATTLRTCNRQPNLVARVCAIDTLQNQFEIEAQFQFTDYNNRIFVADTILVERNDIAFADLAFAVEPQ